MATRYALIDLENVQPESLSKLRKEGFRIKLFVGASQNKIAVDLAAELQDFGSDAEYIRIEGSGKNALDFHIAFYMGKISANEPGSQFLVVAKDTGYDPLLKHMRNCGIPAHRSGVATVKPTTPTPAVNKTAPKKKTPEQMSLKERVEHARKHLAKAGKAKPAKRKTLTTALMTAFQKKLNEPDITNLINELIKHGIIADNQGSISYTLPK